MVGPNWKLPTPGTLYYTSIPALGIFTPMQQEISPVERQFLLSAQLYGASGLNTIVWASRIRGRLAAHRLSDALAQVVGAERALRTRFAVAGADLRRVIDDASTAPEIELRDRSADDATFAQTVERLRDSVVPDGPTWKATLLRHGDTDHTLVFVAHRCIWDEPSTRRLASKISQLYASSSNALRVDETHDLEPADSATTTPPSTEAVDYFARMLDDVPPEYAFPLRAPRSQPPSVEAASITARLDDAVATRLGELAEAWTVDPFLIQAAAAGYTLAVLCGQSVISIGLPVDLRTASSPERLGCLSNILPFAFDTRAGTFAALVGALAELHHGAAPFSNADFSEIARAADKRSTSSAHALFQMAVVDASVPALYLEGCHCEPREATIPPQQLDLFLECAPQALRLGYATAIVAPEVAAGLVRSIASVLSAGVEEPLRPLNELPMLDEAAQSDVVIEPNRTEAPELLETDLHALLSKDLTPSNGRRALSCSGVTMSYGELAKAAEALAAYLAHLGVTSGELIGICLQRQVEMVVAMLATIRLGAAYVPLDPAFPRERLDYMIEHSGLRRILMDDRSNAPTPGDGIERIDVATAIGEGESMTASPSAPTSSLARAYVLYTSGSTGKPKGVTVPRQAVGNFLLSMIERPGIRREDVVCATTTLSFDISVLELLAPLVAGASVVIATEEEARDPVLLGDLLARHDVTLLQATPITWQMLCSSGWTGSSKLKALCGGEALPTALATKLLPLVGELWNMYGPTETTVWSSCCPIHDVDAPISVGTPIRNTRVYVLDDHMRPLPRGFAGHLYIGGAGVALGYLNAEELTAERFVADPFREGRRIYDTGDLARFDLDGQLYVLGRMDLQVKVRGFRIELEEVEARLSTFSGIEQIVCTVRHDDSENAELAAYYVLDGSTQDPSVADLREHCAQTLPAHMVPSLFMRLPSLPRTPNDKLDRKALPAPLPSTGGEDSAGPVRPRSEIERLVLEVWKEVLGLGSLKLTDSFFDLGGTSVLAVEVARKIARRLDTLVPVLKVFEHPTVTSLARYVAGSRADADFVREAQERAKRRREMSKTPTAFDVAIVGMAGRFPGARSLDELWHNLRAGKETVTFFDRQELDPLVPEHERIDPSYIPARGVLEDADLFDAAFFGINPLEAELMDPQLRVFMEVAWEAFENAGYVGETMESPVGVWAGMGNNFYYHYNVLTRPDKLAIVGEIAAEIANEKDHIAPRISHKLNLRGPSLSVHAACSTGLVAVDNAYQALITGQVDVALAGAVDIRTPQKSGQRYEDGGVFSIDGHCRPFDARATGTMFGDGVGAVILKRLDDALAEGDTIHAVVKAAAVNHDGGKKVSYLAPGVEGQAQLIAQALALGDIDPDTITFVEAHGTATPIGDPIEMEALTRVYRTYTRRRQYCAIGSIKGNFGHATTAAGIAGLLKAVLALEHREIPPTIHFETPNPRLNLSTSPFYVNNRLLDWAPPAGLPRRAAVSSFGFCGTNAHVVLEEAPEQTPSQPPSRSMQLVLLSAHDPKALDGGARTLADALSGASETRLADAAYTTQVGRKRLEYRRCAVITGGEEPTALLQSVGSRSASLRSESDDPSVAFMFPGQGSQYINMGHSLYQGERLFREHVDHCARILEPHLELDLRSFLFPPPGDEEAATESLNNTFYTQPAIFTISYALAQRLMSWGVRPNAFIGHSIGEFVAATLAGVMELDDALRLVATRGRLMRDLPRGSMLSVRLPLDTLLERLPKGIDPAAANAPELSVVAGPTDRVQAFAEELKGEGLHCRVLHTSHAFHSSMMDPVVEPFMKVVEKVPLASPTIPFVSTVNGGWIRDADVRDPAYWARHLRQPVLFSDAVRVLLADEQQVLVECGPRRVSATLALQHRPRNPDRVIATMPDSADPADEYASLLMSVGGLWLNGAHLNWSVFHEGERRRRIELPTYQFQRRRFWIAPGNTASFGIDATNLAAIACESEPYPVVHEAEAPNANDPLLDQVVALIEELQGQSLESVDLDARFIALGLDSLLLTQFARSLRGRLGFDVTFRQLTESHSTLRLLLDAVREQRGEPPVSNATASLVAAGVATTQQSAAAPPMAPPLETPISNPPPIQAETRADRPPPTLQARAASDDVARPLFPSATVHVVEPTPAQLEIWIAAQVSQEASCAYNETFSVLLSGDVDDDAMVRALEALPQMHEALRGRFNAEGALFTMDEEIALMIDRHDLSALAPGARDASLQALVEQSSRTPYDLERGPLFRGALVRMSDQEVTVVFGAHHTVCDGWSLDVLLDDLGRLYTALVSGAAPPSRPTRSFSDYVRSHATDAYRQEVQRARAFWRSTLTPAPAPLNLPHDGQRPLTRTFEARSSQLPAPRSSLRAARRLSKEQGLSLFTILFASFTTLLHRLSGASDLIIGVPVAGHLDADMEESVGHLVSLVPVLCRIEPGRSFLEICRHCHGALLDARENASVGFGEILTTMNLPRDPSRPPLITVLFTHAQKYPAGKVQFGQTPFDYRLSPRAYEAFELNLTVLESEDDLLLRAHGNSNLFSQGWLDWRLRELGHLLELLCLAPQTAVGDLDLLPAAEREVLSDWNRTEQPYARELNLAQLIEAQVDRSPDRTAVRASEVELSYAELEQRANRLAHALRELGCARGKRVGICLQRTADLLVAVLAVLKSGAAYVPLDPAFPADRLTYMADDAELTAIVSTTSLSSRHGRSPQSTLNLDTIGDELASRSAERLPQDEQSASPTDGAYVLYTSGSTGKPKGVHVHHRAALNFLLSMEREPGLCADDRLLAVTTLSFDISVFELLLPLSVGAQVVLATREQAMDGAELKRLLADHSITVMQATPITWRILLEGHWSGSPTLKALCGGEALAPDLAEELLEHVAELWNMYGPTETAVWSACSRITEPRSGIHIGRPIANTSIWIRDEHDRLAPIGVPGELFIGGDGVSLGYLNRPELTAERFISDPTHALSGERLYRTGDLGRYRPDGMIECLGRIDNQVKVRGFRIELGEIETMLANLASVRQAVVVAREARPGDARLVAYVLPEGSTPDESSLRSHLRRSLPEYMVPQLFVFVESFPTTPNGKIDKKALPAPTIENIDRPTGQAPRTGVEVAMTGIFAKALGVPEIGVHDNFFDQGGTSFLALTVVRRLNETFATDFRVGILFDNPTAAKLSAVIEEGRGERKRTVVELRKSDGLPTFFVCGLARYEALAKNLGHVCSSYAVYGPEEDSFFENFNDPSVLTIETLAEAYIDAIREAQPEGPYVIGGVSAGGLLAFEVARQLNNQGQRVSSLLLLDALLPGSVQRDWVATVSRQVEYAREHGLRESAKTVTEALLRKRKARRFRQTAREKHPGDRLALLREALQGKTVRTYLAKNPTYDGPALVIRASDALEVRGYRIDRDLGWADRLTGTVTYADAPGGHLGILREKKTATLITNHIHDQFTNGASSTHQTHWRPRIDQLKRFHLFEFNDQQNLPRFMTAWLSRARHHLHEVSQDGRIWAPKILELLKRYGAPKIVDLYSGSGDPILEVARILERDHGIRAHITLTDQNPNLLTAAEINARDDDRTYVTDSVDTTDVPTTYEGVRTILSAFHRLPPEAAYNLLKHAFNTRQHIFIGETTQRSIRAMWTHATALKRCDETNPPVGTTRAQELLTLRLPVLPTMLAWDNIVSCLRTYSHEELAPWLEELSAADYRWEVGELWNSNVQISYPYLMGYPITPGDKSASNPQGQDAEIASGT